MPPILGKEMRWHAPQARSLPKTRAYPGSHSASLSRRFSFARSSQGGKLSKKIWILFSILVLLAGALTGCGSPPELAKAPEPTAVPPTAAAEPVATEVNEPAAGIPEGAALKITGKVDQEIGWLEADVLAMETIEAQSTNTSGETETYTGVSMSKLLEMAVPAAGAATLVFVADDGYSAEVPLDEVLACADCIVSFRSKGGFSTVLPGFEGSLQVKGVVELQVK